MLFSYLGNQGSWDPCFVVVAYACKLLPRHPEILHVQDTLTIEPLELTEIYDGQAHYIVDIFLLPKGVEPSATTIQSW
jgi:hypothetical protein